MKLTYKFCENIMKLFFSAVILQLFGIALGAASGDYLPSAVLSMLEYSAASCTVALGSGLLLEYILRNE